MRTFYLLIVLLSLIAIVVNAGGRGHHHGRRRNTAKFFGYARTSRTSFLNSQTELAKEFLYAHNWVRNKYKLPALKWDENLASFARKYLMERYGDCKMIHSSANYGENMFWGKRLHWTPSDAVYYWYDEMKWFNFASLTCTAPKGHSCDHFTQVAWRDSLRVGCALQHCRVGGMLIACEYDPPGNFDKENPLEAHS